MANEDRHASISPESRVSSITSLEDRNLPDPKQVDALLAKEMNEMTSQEREKAFQEIHCVDKVHVESRDFVRTSLEKLEEELMKLPDDSKQAFLLARMQNSDFVDCPKFRTTFLRAAEFDAVDAALRLTGYLEEKKLLFGAERLTKTVTIGDLDESDKRCLDSGIMQIMPKLDRGGRKVFLWFMMLRGDHSRLSKQRVQFFGLQEASTLAEIQRRGMVIISFNIGVNKMPVSEMAVAFHNPALVRMNQVRCNAFHFCLDAEDDHSLQAAVKVLVGNKTRARFRLHYGTIAKIRSSLSSFGVPTECLPITDEGSYLLHRHKLWIKERYENEEKNESTHDAAQTVRRPVIGPGLAMPARATQGCGDVADATLVSSSPVEREQREQVPSRVKKAITPQTSSIEPTVLDVVCGKGRNITGREGNVRFHSIANKYFTAYEACSSQEKIVIAHQVIHEVKAYGGRFLKQDRGTSEWQEADDDFVREKVAVLFRSVRRELKRKKTSRDASTKESASLPREMTHQQPSQRSASHNSIATIMPLQQTSFPNLAVPLSFMMGPMGRPQTPADVNNELLLRQLQYHQWNGKAK